jgi:hypothetical protein
MGASMATLVGRVKAILLAPATEWPEIEREAETPGATFVRYVAVLAAIPVLARFVGSALIGGYTPIVSGLIAAVGNYAFALALVVAIALIIDALAPRYDGQKNFRKAFRLAAFSFTPVWIAGAFLLIPGLSFLTILGLYGLYLLWVGLPLLLGVPREKAFPFAAAVVVCALALTLLMGVIQVIVWGR